MSVFFGSLLVGQACLLSKGLRVRVAWLGLGSPHLFSVCLRVATFWDSRCKSQIVLRTENSENFIHGRQQWLKGLGMAVLTWCEWTYEDSV